MPSKYNSDATQSIAPQLARAFGVALHRDPDPDDRRPRPRGVREARPSDAQNLTRENLHARIRGLLMMAESNDTGALLISCGNETEIALGYATLYGDMCGGMSLIGDLSKTRRLPPGALRERQARAGEDPRGDVPRSSRPPSWPPASSIRSTTTSSRPIVGELVERRSSAGRAGPAVRAPRARFGPVRARRQG